MCVCLPDLVNVFNVFLPQLLRYPNPNDPLNGEAANLLLRDADKYNDRVRGEEEAGQAGGAQDEDDRRSCLLLCGVCVAGVRQST